ncbi:MAG: hypothetical protein ACKVTZ_24295 [Bacteroidia bacterium]
MRKNAKFILPFLFLAFFLGLSWVVQLLWNGIVVPTFSLNPFTYWQAMGFFLLCRILVGGFRMGGMSHQHQEKWRNMTEEERTQFKEAWRKRCGKGEG